MICHKNGKDVMILSSFSTRSFQKLRNPFSGLEEWYDYHSSTMEQSTRVTNDSIQFGFGESFRNFDEMKKTQEVAHSDCEPETGNCDFKRSFESVKSEAIIVISDKGALAAIEKFGKMVEIFGNLRNSDCPCEAVCYQKRAKSIEKMNFSKYLDYSLEEGSYFNYYLDGFKNYDEVLAAVTSRFVADSLIDIGSISFGNWWVENSQDDFEKQKKAGNIGWDISTSGGNCDKSSNGACWDEETSPANFYRDILALTGGDNGNRDFTVSCRFGLTNEKWAYIDDIPMVIETGDDITLCRNGNYSLDLYDCSGDSCGSRTYGLSALYDPKTEAEPFLKTILTRGDNGKTNSGQNINDAGCRHLSFYNLPDQINSMCFFTQNVFTGAKYVQNLIEQMDQARISRGQQGVGVSFLDATPDRKSVV